MTPEHLSDIQKSFTTQARNFESKSMSFSKQEYLDYIVRCLDLRPDDRVLEAAAGTCACGRAIAGYVRSVVCLDATPAMLAVGEEEATKSGITNMRFLQGLVEELPFEDEQFDIVLTRLAFHHFSHIERPFAEMSRVLRRGGKFVIIDMEAAEEGLREMEDSIERMRDASHVKNRSRDEFVALYQAYDYTVTRQEMTLIPVSLDAWLSLTDTPQESRQEIERLLRGEMCGGSLTGFQPFLKNGEICFEQKWALLIGEKR